MEKVEEKVEAKVENKVDWAGYFYHIRRECPWSYRAWQQGQIDIVEYQSQVIPLGSYQARIYTVNAPQSVLESLARGLDHGVYEWLWSYPGVGEFATPIPCLIQQDRETLNKLRNQIYP